MPSKLEPQDIPFESTTRGFDAASETGHLLELDNYTARQHIQTLEDDSNCSSNFHSSDDEIEETSTEKHSTETTSNSISENLLQGQSSLTYGFVLKASYSHPVKSGSILGICHNTRARQFLLLDANGITSWRYDRTVGPQVQREMNYPNYQYRLYSNLVYDKKHNVYFCLGRDFSLKILNAQFEETYTVDANLRNVMFLLYNPAREELITGGVGGAKIWKFVQVVEQQGWKEVKAMSNYKLQHEYTLGNVGGGWVKRVTLNQELSHLYCCSESDLYAYNLNTGNELFSINGAHSMSITGCIYSPHAGLMVSSSFDSTVKCWIINGGLVHTFRCHSKAVTQVILHPVTSRYILSSSMDCTVKILCLETLSVIYSLTVASAGIRWMGLTPDNTLYACSEREVTMWNINHFLDFFALSRSDITKLWKSGAERKASRLVALNEDNCVRLYNPRTGVHLSSVLPMPCLSPLQRVKSVTYCRELNLLYCLISDSRLWIYTTRTDPSCRIAQWDLIKIQDALITNSELADSESGRAAAFRRASPYRALDEMHANTEVAACTTITILNSYVILHGDEGWCGTVPKLFLLVGLEDGRILFMDPFVRGLLHVDFRANKDKITGLEHDRLNQQLITQCVRNEVSVFQVWSLPSLSLQHELCVYLDVLDFTRLGDLVMFGFEDGAVSFHTLYDVDEDNINRRTNQIKNTEELRHSGLVTKRKEHKDRILNVDCCTKRGLLLSCSADYMIKLWMAKSQQVAGEIILDKTLSSAAFLNQNADLVIGFCRNIYSISYNSALRSMIGLPPDDAVDDSHSSIAQSDVYEDPTVTQEGLIPNLDPIDLRSYLKPFELDMTKDFLEATDIVVRPDESIEKAESEVLSNADTDIYISPRSTPRLSRMDVFTPETVDLDAISSHDGGSRASSRTVSPVSKEPSKQKKSGLTREERLLQLDVTNPQHAAHFLPMFGESPGGTPSVSSAASIADSRSDLEDVSDFEFDSEEMTSDEDGVKHKRVKKKITVTTTEYEKRKIIAKQHKLQFSLTDEEEAVQKARQLKPKKSKYGLDNMKVDVGNLLAEKTSAKKPKAPVDKAQLVKSVLEDADTIALRKQLQAGASELASKRAGRSSKKKQVVARKKAPIGTKKTAVSTLKEEKPEREPEAKPGIQKPATPEKVKYISGDLASGLIPMAAGPGEKKKKESRRGKLIDAAASQSTKYPAEMVKMPIESPDMDIDVPLEAQADDVDLSEFIDDDLDDMECKSAASWNPKFNFERPTSTSMKRQLTPPRSADELRDDDSSAAPSIRLPGIVIEDGGLGALDAIPSRTDALSQWLMGSVPRAVSAASSVRTRPNTNMSVTRPSKQESESKSALKERASAPPGKRRIHVKLDKEYDEIAEDSGRHDRQDKSLSRSQMLGYRSTQRPHTAPIRYSYQDLQEAFEEALMKYQGDSDINKLYRKKAEDFNGDWQEKMIERHKLLTMQKELRVKTAKQKRRFMEQTRMDKRHSLLGHRHCDGLISPETEIDYLPARTNTATSSRPPTQGRLSQSASALDRNQSNNDSASQRKEQLLEKASRIHDSNIRYRFRIDDSLCKQLHNTLLSGGPDRISASPAKSQTSDVKQLYDPRRPENVKPPRTQSIPSRCSRFVLVKSRKSEDRVSSPTPLEQTLLSDRFPQQAQRVFYSQYQLPTTAARDHSSQRTSSSIRDRSSSRSVNQTISASVG